MYMFSKTKSVLSREKIDKIVKANFGTAAIVTDVAELTDGMFNAIYVLSFAEPIEGYQELVLKTGVQTDKYILTYEKEILCTEVFVYGKLAEAGVPIPRIICHDFSHSLVNCDYFFMERLQGETWGKLMREISPENARQLQYDLGVCTAKIHSIKGGYFGYIKDDKSYHYSTWTEAFGSFIHNIVEDGKRGGVDLPYDDILHALNPYWRTLDAVKEPSLINYDMWAKNILLKESDGQYIIDGIIDHERAFYGDPVAEFISTVTICGDLEKATAFQTGYRKLLPFTFGREEQIRLCMYSVYMGLLGGVEIYRYEVDDVPAYLQRCTHMINMSLNNLKKL